MLTALLCPVVQADGEKAEVELRVYIVAPPSVTTIDAKGVGAKRADLYGSLTSLGSASTVLVYFEWGLTTSYGSTTTEQTMTSPGAFRAIITGLTPATTYHFRAVAVGDGTSHGLDRSFTTPGQWWKKLWQWFLSFL